MIESSIDSVRQMFGDLDFRKMNTSLMKPIMGFKVGEEIKTRLEQMDLEYRKSKTMALDTTVNLIDALQTVEQINVA